MTTWAYRLKDDGEIEAQVFEEMPKGWHDSPAKCVQKKRGRPAKDADK